ncbi:MAG: hypothetical protein FWE33_04745 [Defluviitaleaceae bacterium]|nr:hypothetical protein [Defluviitaleaceae bacterium]
MEKQINNLIPITLDKERHVYFSFDVLEKLQEKVGDLTKLGEHIEKMAFLRWLLTLLLNEGAAYIKFVADGTESGAEILTERQVGLIIGAADLAQKSLIETIFKAFNAAFKKKGEIDKEKDFDDEDEDEKEGNEIAGE